MKIWGGISKVPGVYGKQKQVNKAERSAEISSRKDGVTISDQAKDFRTVMKTLKDIPDIRTSIVNDLSSKYEAGKYDVSGNEIAEKLLKSVVDKKI